MNRCWFGLILGCAILAGCGGDPPPPKALTPEEERQFEQDRQKERQSEHGQSEQ